MNRFSPRTSCDALWRRCHCSWHGFWDLSLVARLRCLMHIFFLCYVFFFSLGYVTRDIFATLCLLCLVPYYACGWKESTLRLFDGKKFFVAFFVLVGMGIVFSQSPWASLQFIGRGFNKAFVLPFVAMECVRTTRDVIRVLWALLGASFWQGCNGIYQYVTGFDFVDNAGILAGRLTGSFVDHRVGNYMALVIIPASALYFFFRQHMTSLLSAISLVFLFFPGFFLLIFSYRRNAWLALLVALLCWCFLTQKYFWRILCAGATFVLSLGFIKVTRLSLDVLFNDGRWDLWRFGWAVFQEHPLFGAGFGQYNVSFRTLGLVPTKDLITIEHPHNIYLQLLCESGVVGLCLGVFFLWGIFYWAYVRIKEPLRAEIQQKSIQCIHWRMTSIFWCVWGAYLVTGIVGHQFFQAWWQALVMSYLGVLIGATLHMGGGKSTNFANSVPHK